MKTILKTLKNNPLYVLLAFIPAALATQLGGGPSLLIFIFSCLALIPLAGLIGQATEALAGYLGPKLGGLLNATLGNAAELIITLVAIREGLLDLVKASITGSIIGNLLLVMGFSMLLGGVKNGVQKFDQKQASNHSILLTISVLALVVPTIFSKSIGPEHSIGVESLSLGVAGVMILLYALGILYSIKHQSSPLGYSPHPVGKSGHQAMSVKGAIALLAVSTAGVVWLSELLVGEVEQVVAGLGLSEFFLGIILIPVIGNVAEHLVAVQVARRNQMDLSVEIAVSSSLQIALFVAPLLVFISLFMGNPLTLIFNSFELIALGASILIAVLVSLDGESNWLEGAALLTVYLIFGLAFFLLPA